ncbi:Oidioi.mRNA.OKI2018_I69.chr2.g6330.t1.cds [Oikopleura dioica]|uniref:Oidioi.mRNA.OKI2018_I69.chr2.g6330.t1.cds n=1 Tax=Oikopleura dioica TaxID=34765 RepID=A0ABN7T7G1_OIKDI|nr:Oidioi.mRNA.OKI2018_I69.chr2.g6330.t1.cds [Oikopleura dioica]
MPEDPQNGGSEIILGKRKECSHSCLRIGIKMMKENEILYCQICGEKNPGLLYGGRSCKSCMYFFRRVTFEGITYFCNSTNGKQNCIEETDCIKCRRACRSCRFKACKAAGMAVKKNCSKRASNNFRSDSIDSTNAQSSPSSSPNTAEESNRFSEDTLQALRQAPDLTESHLPAHVHIF